MPERPPVVAVVGGGITGLAAAWAAVRKDPGSAAAPLVTVYEASERLGGRIETVSFAGRPVDTGPDSFITRNPAAEALCRELGLGDELLAPAISEASLFVGGALHPFPEGLVLGVPTDLGALRRSGVLSAAGLARVASDLLLPGRAGRGLAGDDDPSVADVIGPRLGREALERLVEPVIGGINAGVADRLSIRATAPQIATALAGGGGSILRSLRKVRGGRDPAAAPPFLGLARGLGSLVDALAERLASSHVGIRTGAAVTLITRDGLGFALEVGGSTEHVDCVIVALPAHGAAPLLAGLAPVAAAELATIAHASVALLTLSWPVSALPPRPAGPGSGPHGAGGQVLPGSGFLVARGGRHLVTAATFTSSKWPQSTDAGRVLVRTSVGRIDDERPGSLSDGELMLRVREELAGMLGITASPLATILKRFERSFPQYEPGHIAKVERIRRHLAALPGLVLAGAAFDGIGIPACIASGERAAESVLAYVRPA